MYSKMAICFSPNFMVYSIMVYSIWYIYTVYDNLKKSSYYNFYKTYSKRNGDQSQKLKYTLSLLIPILAKNHGGKNYFHRYLSII